MKTIVSLAAIVLCATGAAAAQNNRGVEVPCQQRPFDHAAMVDSAKLPPAYRHGYKVVGEHWEPEIPGHWRAGVCQIQPR